MPIFTKVQSVNTQSKSAMAPADDLDAVADALDQRARNTDVGKLWANPTQSGNLVSSDERTAQ